MKEFVSGSEVFRLSARSSKGPRSENQDSYGWLVCSGGVCESSVDGITGGCRNELTAAIVCDGMGGLPHGRQASAYTVYKLIKAISENSFCDLIDLHLFCKNTLSEVEEALEALYPGSGTTIVMSVFLDGMSAVFHLGDSRAYFHSSTGWSRTYDHAVVDEMFRQGLITEEEENRHPLKNVISKYVGGRFAFNLEFTPVRSSDRIVICSDGAYAYLPKTDFLSLIGSAGDAEDIVERCISGGSRDNTTVVMIRRK